MKIAVFDWCRDLIVRTDIGFNTNEDHKLIACCECKAEKEHRDCNRNGKCIIARDKYEYKFINKKSFKEGGHNG